jgi:uncharacterized membrane protein
MKTNASGRYLVRIRAIMLCAALAAIVGLEVYLGESLAARMGHTTAPQTDGPQAPSVGISDLMAAAR